MENNKRNPSDQQCLIEAIQILDSLGPFSDETKRSEKWRTADQLAGMITQKTGISISPERLERILRKVHMDAMERLDAGKIPDAPVRRAMRPDLTTTKLLWGSTRHLGQIWKGFPKDLKQDPPGAFYPVSNLPADAPTLFISLSHSAIDQATELANKLVSLNFNCWLAPVNIEFGGDIVDHVREALDECDAIIGFVTRHFISSLWCRTELMTALSNQSSTYLVLDSSDDLLLELFRNLRYGTGQGNNHNEDQFSSKILDQIAVEIYDRSLEEQVHKYVQRTQDFASNLFYYLGDKPIFYFPSCPKEPLNTFKLKPIENLVNYF